MSRKIAAVALVACFAVVGAGPATADDAYLVAYMTGAAERPGPGDPDGIGRAVVTIDDAANQLCVVLQFANVTIPTTGFHIHLAPPIGAGPIVVAFANPTSNVFEQCVTVEEALLDNIAANPGQYYTNLHTQPGSDRVPSGASCSRCTASRCRPALQALAPRLPHPAPGEVAEGGDERPEDPTCEHGAPVPGKRLP